MSQDGSMIEIGSSFVRGFRKFNVERSAILSNPALRDGSDSGFGSGAECHLGNTGAIIGKTGWDGDQIRMRFLEG